MLFQVGISASVVSKHTGKGFIAYRVYTPGERPPKREVDDSTGLSLFACYPLQVLFYMVMDVVSAGTAKCTAAKMRAGLVGDWLISK